MVQNKCRISAFFLSPLSILSLATLSSFPASAQDLLLTNPQVNLATHFDVSPPVSELARTAPLPQGPRLIHRVLPPKSRNVGAVAAVDGAIQTAPAPLVSAGVGVNVQGVSMTGSVLNCSNQLGFLVAPPDDNLAVGDTQVVQWVNLCFAVFDKATGAVIAGPIAGNQFWAGFGGRCESENDGDIIVQWDKLAHRWLMSQNVFSSPYLT